ncbi:MAG: hydantoinase/oxoprolinase family protein [Marinicaulis sp.]|nr:hydantoinase/oxoprolinase family protein [Marinicaulis sp.]
MNMAPARLGVDIGGTFTDVVLEVDGAQLSTKELTTYAAPEEAIITAVKRVCADASVEPGSITQFIHGTTLATNALIERRGAKTALITTKGFRDVIEMRTESRFEQYDLNLKLPEPLLPRYQRYVLDERIAANGDVLRPLVERDVEALVEEIADAGYESVAVGFLHSYLNCAHEELVRRVLNDKLPGVMVSLSSEVSPQLREYERFTTVAANAYIKPLMKSYLDRLKDRLKAEGVDCPLFLIHSGGGLISLESAAEFPVRLVESGPAGGAIYAAHVAERYGVNKALSFDMGGTTAKICLIKDYTPKTARVFEVARSFRFKKGSGMPISIPVIDMVEIGAGGGSLAHVDSMRQIRVGPKSAGSEPGPAAYDRGGDKPAVTDADLVLGKLDAENFAGGSIKLSEENAARALDSTIGNILSINTTTAAHGLIEVVDENMANAARVHAVENGEDLSEYTMIAFGGAAPLHAGRLCEKLGLSRFIVPPGAGVGSAIGFLRAPFSFEATRSVYTQISEFDADAVHDLLQILRDEATGFVETCAPGADIDCAFKVYMRYIGQGWEIPVSLSAQFVDAPSAEQYLGQFEKQYAQLFGRTVEGMDVAITVWAANAFADVDHSDAVQSLREETSVLSAASKKIFDAGSESFIDAAVLSRADIPKDGAINGPAAIVERETTIIAPAGSKISRRGDNSIEVAMALKGGAI